MIMLILRIRPKLLRLADYFIGLSAILFACFAVSNVLNYDGITNNVLVFCMVRGFFRPAPFFGLSPLPQ